MENSVTQKKHILLVDDEKTLTDTMSMLLETRGYEVDVANTAADALRKVSGDHDLILLDLVLPDNNGLDVCRSLKGQNDTCHIPIIMLSAHSLYEDKVEGLYLGADDFLIKPCEHEELFARMEAVMRRGKSSRSNYHEEMTICELRRALDDALVIPHFQPIYKLQPFELYGLEVLSRPNTAGSLVTPEMFFKAALRYGLYTELEIMSWSAAMEKLSHVLGNEKIFLNCNPYFIESAKFQRVKQIFERNEISTNNVVLEITERSAITDFRTFFDQLTNYRNYGFHFAVDDVGGGYASLESIVETKPDLVKIDRHIVTNIAQDPFKISIVKFIVSFCRENHITAIAEGIETREDLDTVMELGVDCGQGYFLYKPTAHIDMESFRNSCPSHF
ncbi:MAG: EAL domain-containing protein [Candidatus Omnitrophota bacterium]